MPKEKRQKWLISFTGGLPVDGLPKDVLLACLQTGELELQGQFIPGSNYTLLVEVKSPSSHLTAVYKPERGERPLWDFPYGNLEKREAAAFVVSEALGWELVPPVVYRPDGPLGPGSVQIFIAHDPNYHYFTFTPADIERLRPAVVFDLLINNADRKGGHFLVDPDGHIWLIDHGLCFHTQNKLRTVVWDFAGAVIPDGLLADIEKFLQIMADDQALRQNLQSLISPDEIEALKQRSIQLLKKRKFPEPDETQRQFPWPPV